jgi:polysaccharide export outer membrane protein
MEKQTPRWTCRFFRGSKRTSFKRSSLLSLAVILLAGFFKPGLTILLRIRIMKAKILILSLLLACFGVVSLAQSQEGSTQSGTQSGTQGAALVPASTADTQGIKKYVLGPGDTLDVRVFGQPDLNWTGEVDADGNISSLPFIETPIRAQCRTDKEVQKDITAAYSKYLNKPQVSVRLTGRNSRPPAMVLGAVPAPTRVQMQRRVRLNEVITVSGGFTERANGDIQVLHTEPVMCPEPGEVVEELLTSEGLGSDALRIYKISDLMAGKPEANPVIRPGDVVTVVEAKPVYVTGTVVAPQSLLLREGLTLSRAVAMAGGTISGEAKTNDVRIYRTKPGSAKPEVIRADLAAIKKQKKEDVVLQPYDVIEVPKASEWSPGKLLKTLTGAITGSIGGLATTPAYAIQNRVIY